MSGPVSEAAVLVAFPVGAAVLGATGAALRRPSARASAGIQHFAAGVVFAAVAGEVLPDIRKDALAPVVIGFAVGVVALLVLERFARRAERRADQGAAALPIGLLATVALDLLIDGLLVGIGATLGAGQGRVLTIALTLEMLFLALSMSASLGEGGNRVRAAAIPSALSLSVAVGAIGGAALLGGASRDVLAAVLAFGAAALLYLVTEELLVEAHEVPDTPLLTSMFFIGFLALFTLEGLT